MTEDNPKELILIKNNDDDYDIKFIVDDVL